MNVTRAVNTVTVDELDDALVIGFAKLERGGDGDVEEYVMFQRSLDPDEDDPGIDGVYVERDDQRYCGYGGIVRFVLLRDRATMELDDQIGLALGYPDVWRMLTVCFDLDDRLFLALRAGFMRLFAGCACFVDES